MGISFTTRVFEGFVVLAITCAVLYASWWYASLPEVFIDSVSREPVACDLGYCRIVAVSECSDVLSSTYTHTFVRPGSTVSEIRRASGCKRRVK